MTLDFALNGCRLWKLKSELTALSFGVIYNSLREVILLVEQGGNAALKQVSHSSGMCQSFALAVGILSSLVRRLDSMLLLNSSLLCVILHVSFYLTNKNNKNPFDNSFEILDARCCKNGIYLHV